MQDSNMRPPGYEPGELPTAPLRDINHRNQINNRSISELRVQRYDFLLKPPNVFAIIFQKWCKKAKKQCRKAIKRWLKGYKAMAERLKNDAGKAKKRCRKALKIIFRESSCGAVRSVDAAVLGVLRWAVLPWTAFCYTSTSWAMRGFLYVSCRGAGGAPQDKYGVHCNELTILHRVSFS